MCKTERVRGQGARWVGAGTAGGKDGCRLEAPSESKDQSKQQEFLMIPKAAPSAVGARLSLRLCPPSGHSSKPH